MIGSPPQLSDAEGPAMSRRDWTPIVDAARRIVDASSVPMTLRMLHYRLVSDPDVPYRNTQADYKALSERTARARRDGTFPPLVDRTRRIIRPAAFDDPTRAVLALADGYRLDRTRGQERQIWLAVEKDTLAAWAVQAADPYGIPVIPLRGHPSESYLAEIVAAMRADGRPVVVPYVGDLDPSGEAIEVGFVRRLVDVVGDVSTWRVAVTADQVTEMGLPPQPGKTSDPNAGRFVARHGRLFQVEAEAIPPDVLARLIVDAIVRLIDRDVYEAVLAAEEEDRATIRRLVDG